MCGLWRFVLDGTWHSRDVDGSIRLDSSVLHHDLLEDPLHDEYDVKLMTSWTSNVRSFRVRKLRKLIILVALVGSMVVTFSQSANATSWGAVTVTGLASSKQIVDIDVSDNGQVVAVVGQYDFVYVSTNGGSTWTKPASANPSTRDWIGVDVSPDGTKIVAAYNGYLSPSSGDGGVWYSSDSGATWTNRSPSDGMSTFFRLSDVAMSDNGSKMIACGDVYNSSNTGYIWVSTDSGQSWSFGGSPRKYFRGCTMDSDGSVMYASGNGQSGYGGGGGGVFKSTDNGASWSLKTPTGNTSIDDYMWFVATDATGDSVMVSRYSGSASNLYVSLNGGTTWTASASSYSTVRRTFVSRDGATFVAAVSNGIVTSSNGSSYTATTIAGSSAFSAFSASSDMSKAWATHYSSGIFSNGSFVADVVPPSASWTSPSSPSSSRSLSYSLTFTEAVSGIASSDFSNTGTATGCVFTPSGSSGTSVTVSVTCASDGTVVARLVSNSVSDSASNQGPSTAVSASTVTIDSGSPTATWTAPASPSTSRTLLYTLTFNEAVSGIAAVDFSNTGTATGCVFTPSGSSGTSVTVSVTCASDGTVVARLVSNSVSDSASNQGPSTAVSASTVTIDSGSPTATWTAPASPSTSRTLVYSLTFTEPVSGLTSGDFSNTGTATCTFAVPSGRSTNFSVTATCTTDGTVLIQVGANSVLDDAQNTGPVTAVSAVSVTIDTTTPTTVASATTIAPVISVAPSVSIPGGGPTEATSPRGTSSVAQSTLTTTTTTTTVATTTTTTLPSVDVPEVADDGGGALVVNGERIEATITRENNQLVIAAGVLRARISAVQREGGRAPLDSQGRIRMDQGDSIEIEVTGFGTESEVEVRMYSDPVLLGRSTVSALGSLAASYEVPESVDDGRHTVVLLGESQQGEELTFALAVFIGAESTGPSTLALLVGIPLGLAVVAALVIPAIIRRRRTNEE